MDTDDQPAATNMPPPSPPFALERLSRTLTRYEKKMENVPLLLGIVGTFLCFLPFIASWQKHKNGQYIGPGELFGPNYNYNTTYDDYTYTSYFTTTFYGANPTARSLYHGAAFLAIPTGIDTLLDILQCTTDAIQQRDFKYFMAKVHVGPDAGAGSIIRLTHLERFLFVTGVVLQSFIAFWYRNKRHLEPIEDSASPLSTLSVPPVLNFLQRTYPTWRPLFTVPTAVSVCLSFILSSIWYGTCLIEKYNMNVGTLMYSTAYGVTGLSIGAIIMFMSVFIYSVWQGLAQLYHAGKSSARSARGDDWFRSYVVGAHMWALAINIFPTMLLCIINITYPLDNLSQLGLFNKVCTGLALLSAAIVFVIEMRIRHNEVLRGLQATLEAQLVGARELAGNLHAPLHAAWLGLNILMADFVYSTDPEHASKYAVAQEIMGGCLTAMSLVNDPSHGTHPRAAELDPTAKEAAAGAAAGADDPMLWMAAFRRINVEALCTDCLRPVVFDAVSRGVDVELNGVSLTARGREAPAGSGADTAAFVGYMEVARRVRKALRIDPGGAVSEPSAPAGADTGPPSVAEGLVSRRVGAHDAIEVDKVMMEYVVATLLAGAVAAAAAAAAAAASEGGIGGAPARQVKVAVHCMDKDASFGSRSSRGGHSSDKSGLAPSDADDALLEHHAVARHDPLFFDHLLRSRHLGPDPVLEICLGDIGALGGDSRGNLRGPLAGVEEAKAGAGAADGAFVRRSGGLRLLQRIAACNGGTLTVAAAEAGGSGAGATTAFLTIPLKAAADDMAAQLQALAKLPGHEANDIAALLPRSHNRNGAPSPLPHDRDYDPYMPPPMPTLPPGQPLLVERHLDLSSETYTLKDAHAHGTVDDEEMGAPARSQKPVIRPMVVEGRLSSIGESLVFPDN